jgi:hypothetical protein
MVGLGTSLTADSEIGMDAFFSKGSLFFGTTRFRGVFHWEKSAHDLYVVQSDQYDSLTPLENLNQFTL